jgi:hypothetical protein
MGLGGLEARLMIVGEWFIGPPQPERIIEVTNKTVNKTTNFIEPV